MNKKLGIIPISYTDLEIENAELKEKLDEAHQKLANIEAIYPGKFDTGFKIGEWVPNDEGEQ